jgi:hypothetical protein
LGITNADKAAEYLRYAEHCVEAAKILRDHDARTLHREMAAEWISLAQRAAEDAAFSGKSTRKPRKTSEDRHRSSFGQCLRPLSVSEGAASLPMLAGTDF